MPITSASDQSIPRLRQSGWTVTRYSIHFAAHDALVWLVVGRNGGERLLAAGLSEAEAWYWAIEQAEALGMLRRDA